MTARLELTLRSETEQSVIEHGRTYEHRQPRRPHWRKEGRTTTIRKRNHPFSSVRRLRNDLRTESFLRQHYRIVSILFARRERGENVRKQFSPDEFGRIGWRVSRGISRISSPVESSFTLANAPRLSCTIPAHTTMSEISRKEKRTTNQSAQPISHSGTQISKTALSTQRQSTSSPSSWPFSERIPAAPAPRPFQDTHPHRESAQRDYNQASELLRLA